MAINRRDLIVRGGATAAALTAGGAADDRPGANSDQMGSHRRRRDRRRRRHRNPAAIAAREAGSSVIVVEAQPHVGGMRSAAAATCRSAAAPACRRNMASRIRPTSCSRISPTGRWCSPTARRTIATTTTRSSALSPTIPPRPSSGCGAWRRVPGPAAGPPRRLVRRQFRAAHHARRSDGLDADPDRQARDAGAAHHHVDRQRFDAAARRRRPQGWRAVPARAQDGAAHRENGTSGRVVGLTADHKGARVNVRARKAVIIATGGSPATSTSAACSTRA